MKRARTWLAGLAGLVVLGWLLWPDPVAPSPTGATPEVSASADAQAPSGQRPATHVAALHGRVLRDGVGVAGARVTLKGVGTTEVLTDELGAFQSGALPTGPYLVSATSGVALSEIVGPVMLEPGARIEVTLHLMRGVDVVGRVVDVVTRAPIAGAFIDTPSGRFITQPDGRFAFPGVSPQTWLDVRAAGYLARTSWLALSAGVAPPAIELVLTPASRIEGEVLINGVPVTGATVWADVGRGGYRESSNAAMSDAAGHFAIECGDGRVTVFAVTPQGTRLHSDELSLAVGERRVVVLDGAEALPAAGTVMRQGLPLGGAQVSIVDGRTEATVATAVTDAEGAFTTSPQLPGTYLVQVRLAGVASMAGPFEHRSGAPRWNVVLPVGARLAGRVEPAEAGVRVRCRTGGWAGPSLETSTDASGRFAFDDVPDGIASVDAEGPNGAATARARPGDDVVLVLSQGPVVVRVTDDVGEPVADAQLVAKSLETGAVRQFTTLAPGGVHRTQLPLGGWEVRATAAGLGRSAAARVDVTAAGVDVRLTLEASVAVRGQVVDAASKLPLSGATVRVHAADDGREVAAVTTDARGQFVTPPASRRSTVVVGATGFRVAWSRVSDVNADAARFELARTNDAREQLQPPVAFEGVGMTLDGRSGRPVAISVLEASPAERAGVQVGDVILSVDGIAAEADLNQLVRRIRGPSGTAVRIGFERSGRAFELVLRRRQLYPM